LTASGAAGPHPYERLTPQAVLDALDSVGQRGDGRLLQLNSYENRVFQVFLEDGSAVVAKFYRPGRWSDAQIQEEHDFSLALLAAELPVIAPLPNPAATDTTPAGPTLAHTQIDGLPFRFAIYPCRAGHGPELDDPETLRWLGRFIGRLHTVGAEASFKHRRQLNPPTYGHDALARLLALDIIPPAQLDGWHRTCTQALAQIDSAFESTGSLRQLRLHGDCHPGNILWREQGPQVVDFDDACMGPAVQDLWMLLSGSADAMRGQLAQVLEGYRRFARFDLRELALIEPLRTLRMIHHSAWLAERWTDPAFPAAFPWFGTAGYWGQQTQQLQEQIEAMAQPPLDPSWLD